MRAFILVLFLHVVVLEGAFADEGRYQVRRTSGRVNHSPDQICTLTFEGNNRAVVTVNHRLGEIELSESKALAVKGDLTVLLSLAVKEARGWRKVSNSLAKAGEPEVIHSLWDEQEKTWWALSSIAGQITPTQQLEKLMERFCE